MRVELPAQGIELGLGAGAVQLLGAAHVLLPLKKEADAFVNQQHEARGHQAKTNLPEQLQELERPLAK